jgi:hypothetical protein
MSSDKTKEATEKMSNSQNYSPEDLSIDRWKAIKDKIYRIDARTEEETTPDLKATLKLLQDLKNAQSIDEFFLDPARKNFFLNDCFFSIAKHLINSKTFTRSEVLELSNAILEELVMLFLRLIPEDHIKLADTFRLIMDPQRTYFKVNNQDETGQAPVVVSLISAIVFCSSKITSFFSSTNSLVSSDNTRTSMQTGSKNSRKAIT